MKEIEEKEMNECEGTQEANEYSDLLSVLQPIDPDDCLPCAKFKIGDTVSFRDAQNHGHIGEVLYVYRKDGEFAYKIACSIHLKRTELVANESVVRTLSRNELCAYRNLCKRNAKKRMEASQKSGEQPKERREIPSSMVNDSTLYNAVKNSQDSNSRPIRCVETGEVWPTITSFVKATGCSLRYQMQVLGFGKPFVDGRHYEDARK